MMSGSEQSASRRALRSAWGWSTLDDVKRAGSVLFFVLCVAVSIAGAVNVFADNADVRALAETTACAAKKCDAHRSVALTRLERTPFAQTFELSTPGGPVTVRCRRSAVFVGDYVCDKSD